jgi:hypothetical protein
MKPQRDPHLVIALILLLVAVVFLGGTMRLIRSARAAGISTETAIQAAELSLKANPEEMQNFAVQALTPTEETGPVDQSATSLLSADTGGITGLAIVIVITIIVGAVVGVRATSAKKPSHR